MTVLLWLLTFINFVVLGHLYKTLNKAVKDMGANKDELSRVKNDFNVAIDNVVKKIADLKAGVDVVTPAEIRAAVAEPLARLVELGKSEVVEPPVEPPVVPPVEPTPSVDPVPPSSSFRRGR